MKDINALRKQLAGTDDPTEYDHLTKQLAEAEKEVSLKNAADLKAQRAAAEAHRKVLLQERDDLFAEGEAIKASMNEGKAEVVAGFNAVFANLETLWDKVKRLKEISRQVNSLNLDLNLDEVFGVGPLRWGGADLDNDPYAGIKALTTRMYDLWKFANHPGGVKADGPLTKIKLEHVDWTTKYDLH